MISFAGTALVVWDVRSVWGRHAATGPARRAQNQFPPSTVCLRINKYGHVWSKNVFFLFLCCGPVAAAVASIPANHAPAAIQQRGPAAERSYNGILYNPCRIQTWAHGHSIVLYERRQNYLSTPIITCQVIVDNVGNVCVTSHE